MDMTREFRLLASRSSVSLGDGRHFDAFTYNGRIPGPEIRVKEGETLKVTLDNLLPEETSIHWHGVPVPNAMDGVPGVTQAGVPPGKAFVYEFEARPAGTFFYHSHAGYQLDQGLYGALIIEPASEAGRFDREYTLVLEDRVTQDGGGPKAPRRRPPMGPMGMRGGRMAGSRSGEGEAPLLEPVYDACAVNGRTLETARPLMVKQGERVRLRLINASSTSVYDLALAGHALTVTHLDAHAVKPMTVDTLRIGMGERYDVLFEARNPGFWILGAQERGSGEGRLRVPLRYEGSAATEPVPPMFKEGMRSLSYRDLQAGESEGVKKAGRWPDLSFQQTLGGELHGGFWAINGQVYPRSERLEIREGDLVRVSYWNHSMLPHVVHLHGHFSRLVNPRLPPGLWIKKDTVIVNPMERVEVEFAADNPGVWMHHCQNPYYMMAGMANLLAYRSLPPSDSLST